MARASDSDQYEVSLFPMFNILICTLGVLIFILGALTTLALGVGQSILLKVSDIAEGEVRANIAQEDHTKEPYFIEWDGSVLITHPGGELVYFEEDLKSIDTFEGTYEYMEKVIEGSHFESLIQQIVNSGGTQYVVMLVRPSGFPSLYEVRGYIESKGIELGYEPIMQGWNIRVEK